VIACLNDQDEIWQVGHFALVGSAQIMSIQKFPLATLQRIRQYIQKSLILPDAEQRLQAAFLNESEPPEPDSLDALGDLFRSGGFSQAVESVAPDTLGGWSISTLNPAAVLPKLPGLRLRPGFRLISYLHRTTTEGTGVVWAIPEALSTTTQLEKALTTTDINHPPKPEGALTDFMEAIEGDRSFSSFLVASVLRRELQELGMLGTRCRWSHHRLIDAVPPQLERQVGADRLKELSPRVRLLPDGRTAVEFFSCRVTPPVAIFRHVDLYPADQYTASSLDRAVTGA
jgi:hypothetical protein